MHRVSLVFFTLVTLTLARFNLEHRQFPVPTLSVPGPTNTGTPTGTTATGTGTTATNTATGTDTATTDTATTNTVSSSSSSTASSTSSSIPTDSSTSSAPVTTETQVSTATAIVTDSGSSTSSSTSATASTTGATAGGGDKSVSQGTIIGLSVAGGIAVLGVVAFIIWKVTRKRFSEFDDTGEEIKWPETNNEVHALPTRTTGRSGIDDDGEDIYSNTPRDPSLYGAASTVTGTSMADLHNYNDPYAVPPLPHLNPNQPYRDDPSASNNYYDPYRGPVPQSLHDPVNYRDGAESIPMSSYTSASRQGSSQGVGYSDRVRSPVDGRTSPGPNVAYSAGRMSPGPNTDYYGGQRTQSPGSTAVYGNGRQSPGPTTAYGAGRQSPGPSYSYAP